MTKTRILQTSKGVVAQQMGFTYLILLAAVIVLGIMAEGASTMLSYAARAEAERELLFRGMAYKNAIRSYYQSGKTIKLFPRTLDDLVQDSRYVHRRHLRRLYKDPITNGEWEVIRNGHGGILGVYSSSDKKPMKKAFFPIGLEGFENATHYSEWKFEYKPELKKKLIDKVIIK